jgi:hypothetical protein
MVGGLYQELGRALILEKEAYELGAVTQTYNPSYSGGRDWKDHDSRPVQVKNS